MKKKRTLIILISTVVVLLAGGIFVLVEHNKKSTIQANQSQTQSKNPGGATTQTATTPDTNNTATTTRSLPTPTGQILSSATTSLSSGAMLESTCQTVSGATCDLKLTSPDGTIKYVGAKPVDSSGQVLFDWSAKQIGLSTGTWKVQAITQKDGQTAESPSYNLTVTS